MGRLITLSLTIIFLLSSVFVFAQEQRETKIKCPSIDSLESIRVPLYSGMRNNSVRVLQQALACLDYLNKKDITGYYGKQTIKAVGSFYKDNIIWGSGMIFTGQAKIKLIKIIYEKTNNGGGVFPKPIVKVIYPNGGEVWEVGKEYEIRWDATKFPKHVTVQIGLYDIRYSTEAGPYPEVTIANGILNTGRYRWKVATTGFVFGGSINPDPPNAAYHKIKVYVDGGGDGKFDESDAPFSIVVPPP
ncbi:MAG: peptidoglycan-binding domain-containing protein [Candidatus Aenigmatarchaeota archaeon]